MSSCERCWSESRMYSNYSELIKRTPSCTPEEQAGPGAIVCPQCQRKTVHQYTGECMACHRWNEKELK
ncbi:hypothetical protein LCGC14_2420720 [marine sediment metagenome]|uniref:Uncharacterized protein n=1 Tax=marine sediment metagenome TaxID=412755 RepID=A0A0F9CBY7_9ZZZZ